MQIKSEHKNLQYARQEKIHGDLHQAIHRLVMNSWIEYKRDAEKKRQHHDGYTEPVQLVFHIIGKPPDRTLYIFVYKPGDQAKQQSAARNIRPHVFVKEKDRNLNAPYHKYRKQIKDKSQLIQRHIQGIPTDPDSKDPEAQIGHKRSHTCKNQRGYGIPDTSHEYQSRVKAGTFDYRFPLFEA